MAKNLKTSVQLDTRKAVKNLDALEKKIQSVQSAIERQSKLTNKLNTTSNKLVNVNNKVAQSSNKVASAHNKQAKSVSMLTTKVKRLANAYLGVMGAGAAIRASDTITHAENRLNNLPNGNPKSTQSAMNKMFTASQGARTSYSGMMSNVSKSITLAGDAFDNNIDNAIRFQEIMAKAYTLGGASAAEQHSSMYQMIQGLGSGVLQGDELRSVREGAPVAYKKIEEFAQGVYGAEENLKDLASQGKITSDIVVAAIMSAGKEIDTKFEDTAMTFDQAWTMIKNTALKSFEPVLQMLNDALNSDAGRAIINGIGIAIQVVAKALEITFTLVAKIYNFIANNWGVISKVLLTIAAVIAVTLFPKFIAWLQYLVFVAAYYIYVGTCAVGAAIRAAKAWAIVNWKLLLIIVIISAVIAALIWLSDSFVDACGRIVGTVTAMVSIVWNLFLTLVSLIIQNGIVPLLTAWDAFANFFGNLFNDPIGAIIHAFEGLAQSVLGILQTIANGIDSIFGSNLASAVQGWQSKLGGKADALAAKYGSGTYEEKSNKAGELQAMLNNMQTKLSWQTSDAYKTGYDWGANAFNWVSDKLKNGKDWLSEKLNLTGLPGGLINPTSADDIAKGIKGIGDDTGSIKDSMELTNEDLEYLRKVAEMEWKKEFTTATIQVDMSNYNTVNGDSDLDGIVTKLTDKLYEELNSVANGVYA